jgi:hypothetical protein
MPQEICFSLYFKSDGQIMKADFHAGDDSSVHKFPDVTKQTVTITPLHFINICVILKFA